MKKVILGVALLCSSAGFMLADTYVNSYTRSDGTYVQGHYRSSPDNSKFNNYSTQGNINPHTGKLGTNNPW